MVAYIRKMKDWSVIKWAEPFEWSAPTWSNDNAKGTFKFAPDAPINKEHIGEWLQFGENLWVIKDIKPSETEIVISVQDAFNAFYRSHIVPTGYTETGEFLEAVLNINYKAQGDTEYAMPYLNVSNSDATPLIFPTLKNDILFVMSDYMREVSKRGVKISFIPTFSGIDIEITTHGTSPKAIPMDDGHSQLVKTEFSSSITSKVTVVVEGVNKYWYLQADGTASQGIAPNPRIPGKWETIVLDDEAKSQDEVEKIFAKNTASSQIEFYSDKTFEFNEPVLILHGKKQYKAQISYVEINSDDNRYHYKAGDMPTTLIEKLRPVINNNEATETKSNGSGGGGSTANAVLYTPQLLTEAQKTQARTNIGAGTGSGGGDLTGAVRYDAVQALADTAKSRARNNIGAGTSNFDGQYSSLTGRPTIPTQTSQLYNDSGFGTYTKPLLGIPENDLSAEVQAKLNATADNIITITTEDTDPLYPYMSSKTLAEIKASFAEKSEQFVLYNNISYKLEKFEPRVDLYGGNEKAVFYSTARLVNNVLTYYTCEIYDGEFGYSAADFHTYVVSSGGGGGDATNAVLYTPQSLTDAQKAQARTNIGAYAKPSSGIPKTDLSSDVQSKLDEAITSVNGKTGISVVLGAEDIDVDREGIYGGTTDLEDAVNDLYERVSSRVQIITWVNFEWDAPNNEFVSDLTWAQIQDAYSSGYTVQARLYIDITPMILDYAGISTRSGYERHVFYAATSSNIVVVEMSYDEPRDHDIELSYKPYNQDLTPYRTAAAQDIIDATKQDVIADLSTIRNGATKGATALQSVPATYRTAAAQDALDAQKQHKLTAGANIAIDQSTNNISAVVPVKSVNNEIGSIYLDATNLKTTIPQPYASEPHEVEIYWDAPTDEGSMTVDGVTATRTNLNEAFSDGVKVNVNISFDGATLLANPILYGVVDDVLYIQCYASGYAYGDGTPVQFWLDAGNSLKSQSGRTLNNPMPLPTGSVYTINDYLIALEARIAALENA